MNFNSARPAPDRQTSRRREVVDSRLEAARAKLSKAGFVLEVAKAEATSTYVVRRWGLERPVIGIDALEQFVNQVTGRRS